MKKKRCKSYIKDIGCVAGQGYPLDEECRGHKNNECHETRSEDEEPGSVVYREKIKKSRA
jgi:hypothetical protein